MDPDNGHPGRRRRRQRGHGRAAGGAQRAVELVDWIAAERGLTPEAAYVLASVAADLRISEIVNVPNALVSAALPLDVFESY